MPCPWGIWYLLYVIIDIYSRKVIHWEAWPTENGTLAKEFIEHAIEANGGSAPQAVHADRGTSMTSNTVAGLYARLGIDQSHSRPHVSNDNPYSEANFKTLKYCPAFPGEFGSIEDVNVFCRDFFWYYNNEHRHSGMSVSDILCAGLFAVRFRVFIRNHFLALSDAVLPGLSRGSAEPDFPCRSGADAACPGFPGVLVLLRAPAA